MQITFDVIILLGVNDTGVQPKETTILNTSANMIDEITKETRQKSAKEKYFLNSLKEFPEVTGCSTAGAICPQVCAWRWSCEARMILGSCAFYFFIYVLFFYFYVFLYKLVNCVIKKQKSFLMCKEKLFRKIHSLSTLSYLLLVTV